MAIVTHEMDFARDVSNRVFYMDEGLIYEEGSPQQIFENPQKEKTKAFINRVRSYNYHISSVHFDSYSMNAEIERFCERHVLSKKITNNALLVIEELIAVYNFKRDVIDLDIKLAYSEKLDTLEIIFENPGKAINITDNKELPDELGLMLIRNLTENAEYEKTNGRNKLSLTLKK